MSFEYERYLAYKDIGFDELIIKIKNGIIKAGKYSHLVKVDKDFKVPLKGEVLTRDADTKTGSSKSR